MQRRTIALEAELVEAVKRVAERRGMSLSAYLRRLLRAALALERRGVDPLQLLEDNEVLASLILSGAVPMPPEAVSCISRSCAVEAARRLVEAARALNVDPWRLVVLVASSAGVPAKPESDRITVPVTVPASSLVEAVAREAGFRVERRDGVVVVVRAGAARATPSSPLPAPA